jgi:beta-phosphoglucomutase-like phosphatase (HAD superfamily)
MKFKAVIFDKDGVLVDSEPLQFRANQEVLAEYGHVYTHEDNRVMFVGKGAKQSYPAIQVKYGNHPDFNVGVR